MKKIISITLTFCLLLHLSIAVYGLQGDMNADEKISGADVRLIMQIISGQIVPTEEQLALADFNGDGLVNTSDITAAAKICEDLNPKDNHIKFAQIAPTQKQNSSAKSKFIKVKSIVAETAPASESKDTSHPIYSAFPKGTYDYISGGPYTEAESGDKYYKLKSGRKIFAEDVSVFTGYNMPYNNIHLSKKVAYTESSTDIYLALDWRVPFNINIKPQEYETGYSNGKYNVKDGKFTATYADITFYHTDSVKNNLTFPESDTIKSSKWIVNSEKKTATLRLYLREIGGFYGFNAYYDSKNYLVISIKEPVNTLEGRVIMLDPGHGGVDSGALSKTGYYEKNITWPVANKLKALLEKQGAKVILTRGNSSKEPSIQERRLFAIENNPDLYVAIHTDANTSTGANGCTVFYYKNFSSPLAYSISKELPKAVKSGAGYSLKSKGVNYYPFHVTRVDNCPSVLVECGFITNTNDFNMMKTDKGQNAMAQGLYNGIVKYFT